MASTFEESPDKDDLRKRAREERRIRDIKRHDAKVAAAALNKKRDANALKRHRANKEMRLFFYSRRSALLKYKHKKQLELEEEEKAEASFVRKEGEKEILVERGSRLLLTYRAVVFPHSEFFPVNLFSYSLVIS